MGGKVVGIFLIIFVISLIVGFLTYLVNNDEAPAGILGFVITCIVCSIIPLLILSVSYKTYVDTRTQYDATISQYREAVTMYSDHAKIDTEKAFTDFKYQGYQKNIADFIKELRRKVTCYNETIISKRVMGKNFFFNWLMVEPDDDMKVLSLTKNEEKK
jgi:uncharacterized membrane protein YeaQ/YmgE (transglycosylase-associated protein family)